MPCYTQATRRPPSAPARPHARTRARSIFVDECERQPPRSPRARWRMPPARWCVQCTFCGHLAPHPPGGRRLRPPVPATQPARDTLQRDLRLTRAVFLRAQVQVVMQMPKLYLKRRTRRERL
jgi:hypothetical protein